MRNRLAMFGVALTLPVVAVAVVGAGGAAASTVTPPKQIVLTVASNGTTVTATKGERVVVKLSGDHLDWSQARVIQSTPVLEQVSSTVSAKGSSETVFLVVGYGTAELDATGTPICSTTGACPQYVLLWHAGVDVPVQDPPPPTAG
ncbi:MAG: hypothetical protein ABSB09_00720 [Acidimicrobiales bacterium]|jgi:hypothetical protein